jgi:hypothetical protein
MKAYGVKEERTWRPGCFTSRSEERSSHWIWRWEGHRADLNILEKEKALALVENRTIIRVENSQPWWWAPSIRKFMSNRTACTGLCRCRTGVSRRVRRRCPTTRGLGGLRRRWPASLMEHHEIKGWGLSVRVVTSSEKWQIWDSQKGSAKATFKQPYC